MRAARLRHERGRESARLIAAADTYASGSSGSHRIRNVESGRPATLQNTRSSCPSARLLADTTPRPPSRPGTEGHAMPFDRTGHNRKARRLTRRLPRAPGSLVTPAWPTFARATTARFSDSGATSTFTPGRAPRERAIAFWPRRPLVAQDLSMTRCQSARTAWARAAGSLVLRRSDDPYTAGLTPLTAFSQGRAFVPNRCASVR